MNEQKPLKVVAGAPDRPLVIGDIEIDCFVLEDETRVLSQRGMARGLGMAASTGGQRLTTFIGSKTINPFISKDLMMGIENPIIFQSVSGGRPSHGYPATFLVDMCNAVLCARDEGVLTRQQAHIAERCDTLIRALAVVGIIALVDEATGYQEIRSRKALHQILDKYLLAEQAKWAKRFPDEFYKHIFRLREWEWRGMKVNRPSVVGRYTNDIVWDRLAPGIRKELERLNPTSETGGRKKRHHQWLTEDIGHPALQAHLNGVLALMRASSNWGRFKGSIARAYPKFADQLDFEKLDD